MSEITRFRLLQLLAFAIFASLSFRFPGATPSGAAHSLQPEVSLSSGGTFASQAPMSPLVRWIRRNAPELGFWRVGAGWSDGMPKEAKVFQEWTRRYVAASSSEKPALVSEGVTLAKARRERMVEWIQKTPEQALSYAIPDELRPKLPVEVLEVSERRISGSGRFFKRCAMPTDEALKKGVSEEALELTNHLEIGDETFEAFVYGRRGKLVLIEKSWWYGVALEGKMAVAESAAELLVSGPNAGVALTKKGQLNPTDYPSWLEVEKQANEAEDASNGHQVAGSLAPAWTTGVKKVLVVRFDDFASRLKMPDKAFVDDLMANTVAPFFQKSSFGKTPLEVTVTGKEYALSGPYSLVTASRAQELVGVDYSFADFDRIVFLGVPMPRDTAGYAYLDDKFVWVGHDVSARVINHELGHTFGLRHANLWRTQSTDSPLDSKGVEMEYGDPFDTMGSSYHVGMDFNTHSKFLLHWLEDAEVEEANVAGGKRLYAFDQALHPSGHYAFTTSLGGRTLWWGFRGAGIAGVSGTYAPLEGANCVLAREGQTGSALVDLDPAFGTFRATLGLNRIYESQSGISIEPVSTGSENGVPYLDVKIAINESPVPYAISWGDPRSGLRAAGPENLASMSAASYRTHYILRDGTQGAWGQGSHDLGNDEDLILVAAGGDFGAVFVRRDGTLSALNQFGTARFLIPSGITDVVAVGLGDDHGVALTKDGRVATWGTNRFTGYLTNFVGAKAVAAGYSRTLVVDSTGRVFGWKEGQVPIEVPTSLTHVVSVAAGRDHSMALNADGTVVAWGLNTYGQCSVPAGLHDVRSIAAGAWTSYAILNDDTVVAWGRNDAGQANIPAGLQHVSTLSAGTYHASAVVGKEALPRITSQPENVEIGEYESALFGIFAESAAGAQFHWQRRASGGDWIGVDEGAPFSGTTSSRLNITGASLALNGLQFRCLVSNGKGYTAQSHVATLTITPATSVSDLVRSVAFGGDLSLSVDAEVPAGALVQWRRDGVFISGATGRSLLVPLFDLDDEGLYDYVYTVDGVSNLGRARRALGVAGKIVNSYRRMKRFSPRFEQAATVSILEATPSGRVYAAGDFTSFNGEACSGLIALDASGRRDQSWSIPRIVGGKITSLAVQPDGKLLVGGFFTLVNDVSRVGFARLNEDGTLDSDFVPEPIPFGLSGATGTVLAIALIEDGKIYIGGGFTIVSGGLPRSLVARLNRNGSLDTSFYGSPARFDDARFDWTQYVKAILPSSDGKVILGGNFSHFGGNERKNLLRLNENGTLDTIFDPGTGFNDTVLALARAFGGILVGGEFLSVNGVSHPHLALVTEQGELSQGFTTSTIGRVNGLWAREDGSVNLRSYEGSYVVFPKLGSDGKFQVPYRPVIAVADAVGEGAAVLPSGVLLHAGRSLHDGGQVLNRHALDGTVASSSTLFPRKPAQLLRGEPLSDGRFLVLGTFDTVNGVARDRIAKVDENGALDLTFDAGHALPRYSGFMVVSETGEIIAGGGGEFVRLKSDGALDPDFDSSRSDIAQVLVSNADGTVIGATYREIPGSGGSSQSELIRLFRNGHRDPAFDVADKVRFDQIYDIKGLGDGGVLVSGSNHIDPNYGGVVALDSNGVTLPGWKVSGGSRGLGFLPNGGYYTGWTKVDASGNVDSSWRPVSGVERAVIQQDGALIFVIQKNNYVVVDGHRITAVSRVTSTGHYDPSFEVKGLLSVHEPNGLKALPKRRLWLCGSQVSFDDGYTAAAVILEPTPEIDLSLGSLVRDVGDSGVVEILNPVSGVEYEWYRNGEKLSGTTGRVLSWDSLRNDDAGVYHVETTLNGVRVRSPDVTVTVNGIASGIKGLRAKASFSPIFEKYGPTVGAIHEMPDGSYLVGGDFSAKNGDKRVVKVARFFADGTLDPAFSPAFIDRGEVTAITSDASGAIYIGGTFRRVDGLLRVGLAKLFADGSLDPSFDPGLGAEIRSFAGSSAIIRALRVQRSGKLLVGGLFDTVGGETAVNLARLNANGTIDHNFTNFTLDGWESPGVFSISETQSGDLIVTGDFWKVLTGPGNYIDLGGALKISQDGILDPTFKPGLKLGGKDGTKLQWGFKPRAGGGFWMWGEFESYDGSPAWNLVALNSDLSVDTRFNSGGRVPAPCSQVVERDDGRLVVICGGFSIGLTSDGNMDPVFGIHKVNALVSNAVLLKNGRLLLGVSDIYNPSPFSVFIRVDDGERYENTPLVSFDAVGRFESERLPVLRKPATVDKLVPGPNGSWYAMGDFLTVNGVRAVGFVALKPDGALDHGFDVTHLEDANQRNFSLDTNRLWVSQGFYSSLGSTEESSVRFSVVERYLEDGFVDAARSSITLNGGWVYTMQTLPSGKQLLAGDFTAYESESRGMMARLNSDGSLDRTFSVGAGFNSRVRAVVLEPEGKLLAVGRFTSVVGIRRGGVARLRENGELDTSFSPGSGANDEILAVAEFPDGTIALGGVFTSFSGKARRGLVFLASDGTVLEKDVSVNGSVSALQIASDGNLLAVGTFEGSLGSSASTVLKLTAAGDRVEDFSLDDAPVVSDAGAGPTLVRTALSGEVLVGGSWMKFGDRRSYGLTLFEASSGPRILEQPKDQVLIAGDPLSLTFEADGRPTLRVQWYKDGAAIPNAYGLSYQVSQVDASHAGLYYAVVTNDTGRVGTREAHISILRKPEILEDPVSQNVRLGAAVVLSVLASGYPDVTYQWERNGEAISGARSKWFVVENSVRSLNGDYTVVVTNAAGSVRSKVARVGVHDPVEVISSPSDPEAGDAFTLEAGVFEGTATSYQWYLNGVALAGETGATLHVEIAQSFHAGSYLVKVKIGGHELSSAAVGLSLPRPVADPSAAKLANLSTRAQVLQGDSVLIPGFVLQGLGVKKVLVRAVGPRLNVFGIPIQDLLADPQLELIKALPEGKFESVAFNDDWVDNADAAAVAQIAAGAGAFSLGTPGGADPYDSKSSMLLADLEAGAYTAVARGKDGVTGVAIVEVYDVSGTGPRLVNLSNRGFVGSGNSVMIPGIVVTGTKPRTFLVRAVGPTLEVFGLRKETLLADPMLSVVKVGDSRTLVAENDDWEKAPNDVAEVTQAFASAGAFPLPAGTKDSVLLLTLPPGSYTAVCSGKAGASGNALVEVYEMP